MNIERLLVFIFKYNILIIEILFGVSLFGILLLALRFFTSNEDSVSPSPDWNRLDENIKKILENALAGGAKQVTSTGELSGEIPEGLRDSPYVVELQTKFERSQLQLMQKEEEIKKLSEVSFVAPSSAAPTPVASADVSVYEEKIKDLESRLNEYSIIEDDIADLSFYKEETVRLQSEVDKLTAELAALKEAEVLAVPRPAPAKLEQVIPESPQAAPIAISESKGEFDLVDNDIMAEFERAVAEQKATSVASKTAKAEAKAEAKAVILTKAEEEVEVVIDAQAEVDKLLAENNRESSELSAVSKVKGEASQASNESRNSPSDSGDGTEISEGNINIDKMLNEAEDLTTTDESQDLVNMIDSSLDTDKLLKEATGMGNIDSEALTEFSEFVKKEGA